MKYTLGVDIGGTNTDAVLVDENKKIVAYSKTPTTKPIEKGFENALTILLSKIDISQENIKGIFVGTTHATNAILEKKDLYKVGLIRIAGHFPESLPPCFEFEEEMKSLLVDYKTINGGYECDGKEISSFDIEEANLAIEELIKKGAESIAVIGVFSPIYNDMEKKLSDLIKQRKGNFFPISLSHEIGNIGFIERENTTILNAALQKCLKLGFQNLKNILKKLDIKASLFLTQNNGSLLSLEKALQYPILTISSGPTNSFVGAARLANKQNCIIVDIGGTSTDIGIVKNGYVRRSLNLSKIGDITLNFSMPDVLSTSIGGGSKIIINEKNIKIGPESVGKDLINKAICFKGNILTLTDVAVALRPNLLAAKANVDLQPKKAQKVLIQALEEIKSLINEIEGKEKTLPIILVGGGAKLFESIFLENRVLIPIHYNVANAYGAALSEISSTIDVITSLIDREKVLREIKQKVINKAIFNGSNSSNVQIVDVQIIPYHYVPNFLARVIITAMGKRL